jgi:hypothetical protein
MIEGGVNANFAINNLNLVIGGAHSVTRTVRHNWIEGCLKFKVKWNAEQITWEEELCDLKEDHPRKMAN